MITKEIARDSRLKVLELVYKAQTSHVGSLMGAADIFAVLFGKFDFEKDKIVLGKSWAACLLYYHFWKHGRITEEQLNSYCQDGSNFIGLAEPFGDTTFPFGIGSMGMGLPASVGLALSKKMKKEEGIVYCLMSDGEMAIGTTHESALIAAHHKLDNLVVILEDNKLCAMGRTREILNWSFPTNGWRYILVDGHNHGALLAGLEGRFYDMSHSYEGCPRLIHAETIKGFPISFMRDNNTFHYKAPSLAEYEQAMVELTNEK